MSRRSDIDQLKLLGLFHYILAGLTFVFGFFPFIHLALGIMMVTGTLDNGRSPGPPPVVGWIFVGVAAFVILFLWTIAVLLAVAGSRLRQQRSFMFCVIVAALACMQMPLGTILGVFTLIVLFRTGVRDIFEGRPPSDPEEDVAAYE